MLRPRDEVFVQASELHGCGRLQFGFRHLILSPRLGGGGGFHSRIVGREAPDEAPMIPASLAALQEPFQL